MSATRDVASAARSSIPELRFGVQGSEAVQYTAVPTLKFALRIDGPGGQPIRSILLDVQIQIAARQRGYGHGEQQRLLELFGTPERWGTTLRTLPWTRITSVVPPFAGRTLAELPVACTYDLEVTGSRYLAALEDGEVPLEFLLSGTVFFSKPTGALQAVRLAWDHEVTYRMPAARWREAMERHFPNTAWLRLGRERFDRLCSYKARHAFETWDAAIDALLDDKELL